LGINDKGDVVNFSFRSLILLTYALGVIPNSFLKRAVKEGTLSKPTLKQVSLIDKLVSSNFCACWSLLSWRYLWGDKPNDC